MIEIIKEPTEDKPFLVIYKPKNLPSAPLSPEDTNNALYQAIELFPEIKTVQGKKPVEYGLLHRLDTATDGLIVIAATQECYDFLMSEQEAGRFIKTYEAQCNIISDNSERLGGFPPEHPEISELTNVSSFFRPYGEGRKEVRPVTENSGKAALAKLGKQKLYTTKIKIEKLSATKAHAVCEITQGYRHQVRCHLAWAGYPVCNDPLYNSNFRQKASDKKNAENLMFSATKISFEYPRGDLNSYDRKDTWT